MRTVEELFSHSMKAVLRDLPEGAYIPDSEEFRSALSALEYLIPSIIGEIHPEMLGQALDGMLPAISRKIADGEAEVLGHVCFISDQTLTPLHLRLQLSSRGDEISWLECRLGERTEQGMRRTPYGSPGATGRLLAMLDRRKAGIDWCYEVTFGERH